MTIILDNPMLEQEIPLDVIHADPIQPRIHPDAELSESIKTQGILQAITLEPITPDSIPDTVCPDCERAFVELAEEGGHFLINDGERRYRGSIAAGRDTILAKIIPPSTEGDRLKRQLTSNTGKPLTPIEEAFAFKRIMEVEGWSQVELAKQLGRPRSVIGDRIRLTDLDPAWLDLIQKGKVQASGAAPIHLYAGVPSEYQAKAAVALVEDYRAKRFTDEGLPVPLKELQQLLYVVFRDYIKEMSKVKGYDGPVIEITGMYSDRKEKFAADIKLWRPIFNKLERERTKAQRVANGSQRQQPRAVGKKLAALGLQERTSTGYNDDTKKGEARVYTGRWSRGVDPKTFLAHVSREKLVLVKPKYGEPEIVTSDLAAVALAEDAYTDGYWKSIEGELAKVRKALTPETLEAARASGPGVRVLLSQCRSTEELSFLGAALGIKANAIDDDDEEADDKAFSTVADADIERIAAAFVLSSTGKIKLPELWQLKQRYDAKIQSVPFELAPPSDAKITEKAAKKERGQKLGKEIATARKNGAKFAVDANGVRYPIFADQLKAERAATAKAEQIEEATA